MHEYILCYSKQEIIDIESRLSNEQIKEYEKNKDGNYNIRGGFVTQPLMTNSLDDRENLQYTIEYKGEIIEPRKQWVWEESRLQNAIDNNEVIFKKKKDGLFSVRTKVYLKDKEGNIRNGKPLSLMNGPFNQMGTQEVATLLGKGIFSFPKPSELLKYLFSFSLNNIADNSGIYLDFFTGSGTTAHSVLSLNKEDDGNRKYILVQLPEPCDENSEAYKAGYKNIADIGKERIRRVIEKIKEDKQTKLDVDGATGKQDLGFKVFKLQKSNFKIWRSDVTNEEELVNQLDKFTDPVDKKSETENILYELLLKSGVPLTAKIEEKDDCYLANNGEIALMLKKIDENIIKDMISEKPQKVITLDRLFKDNDQLKTNTALQMKDAELDFRVV